MKVYHAQLYLERLSRDSSNFKSNQNTNWSSSKFLEKAFLERYPNLKDSYDVFMKSEEQKWGNLFCESFKKHSLSVFVESNVNHSDFIY